MPEPNAAMHHNCPTPHRSVRLEGVCGMQKGIPSLLALFCLTGSAFCADPAPTPPALEIDLSSPSGKAVQERLTAIEREITRLHENRAEARAEQLRIELLRIRQLLNTKQSIAADPELHAVGDHKGNFPNGPRN